MNFDGELESNRMCSAIFRTGLFEVFKPRLKSSKRPEFYIGLYGSRILEMQINRSNGS